MDTTQGFQTYSLCMLQKRERLTCIKLSGAVLLTDTGMVEGALA
jgi:hypothetical protein